MMNIENNIFKGTKINTKKLLDYGFIKDNNKYTYSKIIMNDNFRADITIEENGTVSGKIIDLSFNEEYTNFRIEDNIGSFIGQVRDEYITILKDIKNKCFTKEYFIFEQSNRIANMLQEKYGTEPEFEWEKYPNDAIFRNPSSKKWYGLIMGIDRSKLEPTSSGEIEVIDIKLDPEKIERLLKQNGFYPAYHMNKKYWITITLDNTIPDEDILNLIAESYAYTLKK